MAEELFNNNKYARDKLDDAKNVLKKEYYQRSRLDKLVGVKDADTNDKGFSNLYFRHHIPREWFEREDVSVYHVFSQFGENLAISEVKYILDQTLKNQDIPSININENVLEDFLLNFKKLSKIQRISALFIPIEFYVNMYTDWPSKSSDLLINPQTGDITICGTRPVIIWSNKYLPFNEIILIDRRFILWYSKPSFNERLTIKISEINQDLLDLLFFTTMRFDFADVKKALILRRHKSNNAQD